MKRAFLACLLVACGGKVELVPPPPPPPAEDAGASIDAGTEAATEADAIAVTSDADASSTAGACVPGDDFDEPIAPHPEWTVTGTSLEVVDTTFTSAPHSLLVGAASYLSTDCSNVTYGMKLVGQVRIDADGTAGTPPVLAAIVTSQGQKVELSAVPGTTNGRCTMSGYGGPPVVHDFTMTRGAWHDFGLKISFNSDGTNNLLCIVDATDHSLWNVPASQTLGTTTLHIGADSTPQGPVEIYFDDVLVEGS